MKDKTKEKLIEEIKFLQKRIAELEITNARRKQQQQQQQQQQRRLATVVLDSNDAITLKDFDGRITAWNHGAELMYGYSEKEALQMNVRQLTPPDKEIEHAEFIRRLMAGETIHSFETQRVAKDGRTLDVWLTATKVVDDTRKPIGIATTERDITERKKAEQAIEDTAYQFQAVVESVGEGITFSNNSGKFLIYNLRMQQITGFTVDEANNSGDFTRLLYPEPLEHQKALQRLQEIVEHKVALPLEVETTIQAKDGTKKALWVSTVEMRFKDQEMFLSIYRDITERKKREQVLRESEAWLAAVLKGVGDGMIVTDGQGHVVFVNAVAQLLTGWKQEEAKGLLLKDIFNIVNEEIGKEVEDPVAKVIREGTAVGLGNHTVLITRDGIRRPIDDSAAPVKDSQGNFIGVVLVFRDVTERRNAERKIKEALQAKSAFTSMVSHELRTPLSALKESVSQVLEGLLGTINEDQRKFLGIAKNNVDRLARLITEVLDFQTLETGKMAFKMQDNDINEVVKETKEMMNVIAQEKGLDFILNLDEELPKIKFDRDKVSQVLVNLVNNSLKLTEKGNITISTTKGNNVIQVSVKDTGPGIKEEDMPRLFQHYEQLERKVGGTGLGLAISLEIIKAHGGKIWAESIFGQGTTMHFILPIE